MSRFDYDTIFYRVFCATILGIAFTFTVILTNVFIDIDGLLSKKHETTTPTPNVVDSYKVEDSKSEFQYNDESNYMDDTETYRAKRSIDRTNLYEVKNPNIKKILTNKLATLLEEMDEEETSKKKEEKKIKETRRKEDLDEPGGDNMLHLAMHNILLQGITGHMDLKDVYKKVHTLFRNFYVDKAVPQKLDTLKSSKEFGIENIKQPNTEESKFFEELLKCKTLQTQLKEGNLHLIKNHSEHSFAKRKDPKVLIKTVIEINENRKLRDSDSPNKEITGLIKLIYNGKSVKFKEMDEDITQKPYKSFNAVRLGSTTEALTTTTAQYNDESISSNPAFNKMIEKYLSQYPFQKQNKAIPKSEHNRSKRQIKIHYDKHTTLRPKAHGKNKKDEEELYIEIETHFDGKGSKGEKKKKLVRSLIDKIQKAINEGETNGKKTMFKHIRVKKRNQNPLKPKYDYFLKNIVPSLLNIDHREVDPIGKILPPVENILDSNGEHWTRKYSGPSFLTPTKSVNSAEVGELVVNYDSILKNNIPKRIQKPLNIKNGVNVDEANNVTFFIKDVDGSGFSVGFNQYVDEPPDTDSLKLFNGLENIIQEYHKSYDSDVGINGEKTVASAEGPAYATRQQESLKNSHDISRRSINNDHHNSYYKSLIKKIRSLKRTKSNIRSRNSGSDLHTSIYQIYPKNINLVSEPISVKDVSFVFNNNFYNNFKSHSKGSGLKRKRRSLSVKKISNINSKMKINKFINTKKVIKKKLYIKNNRNKREVSKIRIIARDPSSEKNSNENVFLVSPESLNSGRNSFAKESLLPEAVGDNSEIQNSDILPLSEFLDLSNYANQPTLSDEAQNMQQFELMSKYPHIFFEEIPKTDDYSVEEKPVPKPYRIQARSNKRIQPKIEQNNNLVPMPSLSNVKIPGVEDFVGSVIPDPKSNYRISVKISPKNMTNDLHSGFKEIHTSVNKSYDKNGLRYFSSLNVSQISKIENISESSQVPNKTEVRRSYGHVPKDFYSVANDEIKEREKEMKALIEIHKRRIDEQLEKLQSERRFLKNLLSKKGYDVPLNDFPVEMKPVEIRENECHHSHNCMTLTHVTIESTTQTITTTISTTPAPTTVTTQPTTTTIKPAFDKDKQFLADIIKRNEKTTKEILRKLSDNSNLLMLLLSKLSRHFDGTTTTTTKPTMTTKESKPWKGYVPNNPVYRQFTQFQNGTHTIPFIYTYPQPEKGIGPIIPHHIQTNEILSHNTVQHNVNLNKPINPNFANNESRFFIDELENINPDVSATIKINATHY